MNSRKPELSDEDFAALLAKPDEAAGEAADLRAALRSYRDETLQWAERRSATQPSLQPAARRSRVWAAVPQWSLAAVAVISIAAGVAHVYDRYDAGDAEVTEPVAAVAAPASARTSPADIAADNRLLSSIDQALSSRATPLTDLEARPARHDRTTSAGVID